MPVSEFQNHIRDRIEYQAQLVEKVRLGSAKQIRDELENKLAQAWSLIRDEVDIPGIVTKLARRDCPDLTWELHHRETSPHLVAGGGSGDVWKGKLLDGSPVALKALRQYGSVREQLRHGRFEAVWISSVP